ncbi:protein-L-isoaspartate O-methyltransferase [Oleiagrimonas sp. C23AA]|uniref:protein-L-isoaspartate O-methyltransferase family protein n=1 Tax=Oleiagrimonas sp. C23AA TaxID=2719047 RepID=UPI001421042F|nr:protein-L-isoaspartate O-methyltransferase [Oleiagrimonas sp. C23AA]NII12290.1 protein-L-isoaspartate O-methyltransferase [Oleiagrimonas sp. C23AA]
MTMNFDLARQNMVENQVRTWEVVNHRVLNTLTDVRREDFVPTAYRNTAFSDVTLPLGHNEVMMKPVLEGRVLQALLPTDEERVLEIGTGSGFLTACLARMAKHVTSVDMHADFVDAAQTRLAQAGIDNVALSVAEAVNGYTPDGVFDVIAVTGAVYTIPEKFVRWLKPGGRMFVIRGTSPAMEAVLLHHEGEGRFRIESLFETDLPYLAHAAEPKRFTL